MTLAIMSALLDEQRGLLEQLKHPKQVQRAGRTFWCGQWAGHDVVLVLTKVGKVAAATTTAALIDAFGVDQVVFTGVAGGIGEGVGVGDVVVANAFIQHDMDASPLFARYEIPLYGCASMACDAHLTAILLEASNTGLAGVGSHFHHEKLLKSPNVHSGLIASGDRFVSSAQDAGQVRQGLQAAGFEALAVEMEGAAVAQVCRDYGVPFAAVRTISDRADDDAHVDFSAFVKQVASPYALAIVSQFVKML
ncbi:MAG: 5'-methylthioadenosine/adenosylhomocysteine nucleosidase [Rhodoferax sp.]|uniref:5'-methylthioadenosine/adenosylhomocysteine nucleosidase n=1 Tax=Rhodoferax sp. TaxID=50421 RepID=UPI002630691B|nr:5'-methylthioadenosine/adenosylhomocysteine nucleosidase [Rhodoferax sp.]MDD2879984.1 5'-methylthioadenosine/adenosylhomocysteine nucleosidase [Rhodoferax sp.]